VGKEVQREQDAPTGPGYGERRRDNGHGGRWDRRAFSLLAGAIR
jgi:hypothetical protein